MHGRFRSIRVCSFRLSGSLRILSQARLLHASTALGHVGVVASTRETESSALCLISCVEEPGKDRRVRGKADHRWRLGSVKTSFEKSGSSLISFFRAVTLDCCIKALAPPKVPASLQAARRSSIPVQTVLLGKGILRCSATQLPSVAPVPFPFTLGLRHLLLFRKRVASSSPP